MQPDIYFELKKKFPIESVSFGYGGVKLLNEEEAQKEQIGIKNADWFTGQYVIGYESALGDPYLVDINNPDLPVYKYSIGSQREPRLVNSSVFSFFETIRVYKHLSAGRENTVAYRKNKLGLFKKLRFINQVKKIDSNASKSHWWLMIHG